MYAFTLNMWIMKRITEAQVRDLETRGYLTQQEVDMILATPQQ
jgi:hypothetical protein